MYELKNLEINIPVAPHKCTGNVVVRPETTPCNGRRARIEVTTSVAAGKVVWSGHVVGHPKEAVTVNEVKQQQRPKKIVSLSVGTTLFRIINAAFHPGLILLHLILL